MLRLWVIGAVVLALWTAAAQATAHAIINEAFSVEDVRRPIYRGNIRTRESKSDAVSGPTAPSTTATPIGESLRAVTKQLLQPTDMVATDVRTPPRVRTKVGEAKVEKVGEGMVKAERIVEGIGEAIPIDSVTQGPGLSTWILLSSDQAKNRPSTQATIQAVEKTKKNETIKGKPSINKMPTRKVNSTISTEEATKSPIILQDSKFKNRTPVIVGKIPTTPTDNQTKTTVITTTPPSKKKISAAPTQPTKFIEIVPTTSLILESDTIENTEETSTTETTTTTKKTKRPGTKKKKKNKNRRRRPSKPEDAAESKITPQETSIISNKIDGIPIRPLSTRIYNYLAREVMPSVGVGIVGLVLTAGLAGLLLYPFGGGVARRNYEKVSTPQSNYYYSDYVPHREDQINSADNKIYTPSSNALGHNSYVPSYDSKYNSNKYRYEQDYGQTVNGYAGNNEYSTLPDSVKNPEYSLSDGTKYYSMDPMSSHYKLTDIDSTQYKLTEGDNSQYKITTGDASQYKLTNRDPAQYKITNEDTTHYKITDRETPQYKITNEDTSSYKLPSDDNTQPYKLTDMHTASYKLTDSESYKELANYPSLTEYTSYTNAASVGTRNGNYGSMEANQTDSKEEDKSDKSPPEFSALVGSPQFTNTDFVGSVSLTGSYGADGTGALASEHGPRALRSKRNVHDDFTNEIDVTDEKILKTPHQQLSTEAPKVDMTTDFKTTSEPLSTTESPEIESTTQFNLMNYFTDETVKDEPGTTSMDGPGGFMSFIKRIAQLKLKIGISLLRSTSDAVQRYFDNMAKRMEEAVRHLQKRRRSLLFSSSRARRDNIKVNKSKNNKIKKND